MKKINVVDAFESNQECNISYKNPISSTWIVSVRLEIADILRVCRAKGANLTILIQCLLCKTY